MEYFKDGLHGFCFGLGFAVTLGIWQFTDRFIADLNWKFWQWKRRIYKSAQGEAKERE